MDASPDPMPQSARMLLDTICTTGVYAEIRDDIKPARVEAAPGLYLVTAHLKLVTESGGLFTTDDLDRMCLNRNELRTFEEFYARRAGKLATFLPKGTERVRIDPEDTLVDDDGHVQVLFSLSGYCNE